jgi:hypothetical protein
MLSSLGRRRFSIVVVRAVFLRAWPVIVAP